jgi:hypothetical protein
LVRRLQRARHHDHAAEGHGEPEFLHQSHQHSGTDKAHRESCRQRIKGGYGTGYLSATTAGRFTYRYRVPAHTYNGLSVAAAYSPNFVLTVKP